MLITALMLTVAGGLILGSEKDKSKTANSSTVSASSAEVTPDRGQSYYHYMLGHTLEEQGKVHEAIEEYKLAIKYDPTSSFLSSELAAAYARNSSIKDAVTAAEEAVKKDPNNLDAHRLLGNVYRSLIGDTDEPVAGSESMLNKALDQYLAITRIEPTSTDDLLILGQLYRRANKNTEALNTFKHCLELEPDSEGCLTNLAFLYTDLSDNDQAIALLEKNLPKKVDSAQLYVAMGYAYQRSKNYKRAIELYRKAIQLDHSNLNVNRSLAESLLQDGQLKASLDEYKAIVETDKSDADSYLRIGQIYRRMGNYDAALQNFLSAQLLRPDSLDVTYNLALLYEEQEKYDEALAKLNDLLKITEKKNGTYTASELNNRGVFVERVGMVYRKMEKVPEAIKAFEQLRDLDKDHAVEAEGLIIDTYRETRDFDKALAEVTVAIEKFPDKRRFKLQQADVMDDKGDYNGAMAALQKLLANNKDDREVYLSMAQIQQKEKHFSEAEKSILAAQPFAANDDQREGVLFFLGAIYERQKKYDLAETTFHQTLKMDPQNAAALNYLGYMLADRGVRVEEGLKYIQQAVDLEPTNGAYLDSLGWAYYKLKKYDQAETNLLKAIEKLPKDPTIHDHLGDVYLATDRLKQAAAEYEKSLRWYNSSPEQASNVDPADMDKVQKKLDELKARLAQNVNK
ncbi:MAG: tetratricopeptide repeat protein [Acidobacteriia bacterium]|nr:tetratricopeptide repeat protein [Terriglobia bacterium]